ncbi:DUF397 domain-containing protein [Nocardia sp. NPDC059091]|uniref:DUF397 domain-containing protein n=1 Tax=Nocardia sp. NPDC059091 TaxID=3346724 RepID=UPI00367905AB
MNVHLPNAQWFKSSYSQAGGECVEVAFLDGGKVGVRDSKDADGPALVFTPGEWDVFTRCLGSGGFDCPRS